MDNNNSLSQNEESFSDDDEIAEEPLKSTNIFIKTNQITERHPTCQFESDKSWLDCQYHDLESTLIRKPDEIENEMEDPPINYDQNILDRIQGSMFGLTLGDALGAHVEFRPRGYLVENPVDDLQGGGTWGLQKGQFTDDTSMALCLANSLIARREFHCYDQLVRYQWWYIHGYMSSTGQCFDIGSATRQSLTEFADRQQTFSSENDIPIKDLDFLDNPDLIRKFDVYCSKEGVAGNGALMRLAPVPLFFYKCPVQAVEFSGISGLITHGDQKAYDACRYYGALIVAALHGETKEQLLDKDFYLNHQDWFDGKEPHTDIMNIIQGSYQKEGGYEDGIRGKGYIVDALQAALWAFWSDENSFKKGALAAVNLGDDTDTTAAIYGQLAGAYYGYQNLPDEWIQQVYAKKFIETLSKWIAYEGQKQTEQIISEQTILFPIKLPDDQTTTPPVTSDHLESQADEEPTSSTTSDHLISQDDQKITPPTTPTVTKPQDDAEATSPTTPDHVKSQSQDDQKITPPTTPIITKPQDDAEATLSTSPPVEKSLNDQEVTPPTTPDHVKSQDDEEPTSPTTSDHVKSQEDQKITPPTTPTDVKSQNDAEVTSPTTSDHVKSQSQDDQKITPPTTPTVTKPQDDEEPTSPTTSDHVKSQSQDDQKITPPTTPTDAKPQADEAPTSPTTPIATKPQDNVKAASPTTPTDAKSQDDEETTPSITSDYEKSETDEEAISPTTRDHKKSQADEEATLSTTLTDAKIQEDEDTTPQTTTDQVKSQDDEKITPTSAHKYVNIQADEETIPPTTPDNVKLQDDEIVTPPISPTITKPQDDEVATSSSTTSVDEKTQDDQKPTPPTTPIHVKSQEDQNVTPPTSPAVAKPQEDENITLSTSPPVGKSLNDQEVTPPTTPDQVKSEDDEEATPSTTHDRVKLQDDEKVTPPTTPVDAKLQDDQNLTLKTPVIGMLQDDENITRRTSSDANSQEDLNETSTALSEVQRENDQSTIPSTLNNVNSEKNLTSTPTSPQTLDSNRYTPYEYTELPKSSTRISNEAPVYQSSYEYESHRSDQTRYSSQNTHDKKPFSNESTSYQWSTTKPTNLNKNLLLWTVNDVSHWVESFGNNYSTYANSFREDYIDGFRLYNFINDNILIEYGVRNEDHRRQILIAIQQLRKEFLNERRYR